MTNKRLSIEQRIRQDRVDLLFKRSNSATLALFVICTIYVLLLVNRYAWPLLLAWYIFLIIVLLGRWYLVFKYNEAKSHGSLSSWLSMFRLGIFATGLTIGSLSFFFFLQESLPYQLLAIMFPIGITAAAVTILPDFVSFFIYASTLMMPVVLQAAMVGGRLHLGISITIFALILFFLKSSKAFNEVFISSMRLSFENIALVEDLKEEKNKLNNRLGRILNDSSNEIYIAEADTLNLLQVNIGAVENLGYSQDEFAEINLLDVFFDLDRCAFTALISPLSSSRQETVIHKGLNRRKDGTTYPVEARLQLSSHDVPPIIVVTVQDITERSEWEEKLIYQASFDQLTGLLNRHYMQSYMGSAFTRARRKRQKVALLYVDLDNFKIINDTFGHDIGDEVLKQTAGRIRSLLRESDTPARTGGDEFTVMLEGLEETRHVEVVARKLVNIFKQPFIVEKREVHSSVSVGISIYPDDSESLDQLMQYADMAMYQAKENGRNNYCFFSQEMSRSSEEQVLVIKHLRYALAKNEFSLSFQPKIDIIKRRIIGAEALIRWHNPEIGDIPPDKFISLAENMGFIESIGTWVLETACREAMRWQEFSSEKLHVSVNISSQQFRTGSLVKAVDSALASSGLPSDQLELEITESLLLQDSDKPLAILNDLHDRGISLALDDFGTGYSSLSYLRRFPLQVLKIDRSFIGDLEENQNSRALVEAIIAMAHSLKLEIVAEGIENEMQLVFLRQRGVRIIQGYFFSPPVPAEKFTAFLQNEAMIVRLPAIA